MPLLACACRKKRSARVWTSRPTAKPPTKTDPLTHLAKDPVARRVFCSGAPEPDVLNSDVKNLQLPLVMRTLTLQTWFPPPAERSPYLSGYSPSAAAPRFFLSAFFVWLAAPPHFASCESSFLTA